MAGTPAALGIADYAAYAGTIAPPASGPATLPPVVTGAAVASVQPSE